MTILAAALFALGGRTEVSSEQAAQLSGKLTPLGAIQAGNAAGTIPPWNGGITTPPSEYTPGQHHPDPFADDEILFTITADNMEKYRDKLTAGHQALLKTYPKTYKMNVYASRRSASFPQHVYDATVKNATTAKLAEGGNGIQDAIIGIPFPITKSGQEAIWNHIVRYRGKTVARFIAQAAPTRHGSYTLVQLEDELDFLYAKPDAKFAELNNILLYFKQKIRSPARLAGSILVVHETLNQVSESRKAWVYNTGQRRVRRAPNVAYDNPGTAADGMRTNDQFDMYNGAINRYDWELAGRQEYYVPYNAYRLHSDTLKYKDILTPLHINADLPRYELHRVWVVNAVVKKGARHIYARRTFYLDEDSWQALVIDQHDNRDRMWRVSEGHVINYYEEPTLWTTLETHTDLQAGRYLAIGLDNETKMYDFNIQRKARDYTPAALRRAGRR
ncbi:MAG: DUF1329 domain-containing protein [Gammaproteobacteria bacterium]|nr:DUF1329 domain-containing protein [Gammaproteobacteria bacterium]